MRIVNISEAGANLSKLVEQALRGDEVIIARAGRPLVRLLPVSPDDSPRDLSRGLWEGQVRIADDFDELPDELLRAFEGGDEGGDGEEPAP